MSNHEQSQKNIHQNVDVETFTVTTEDAVDRFAQAGVPRSLPSINRFCKNGNLSCRKLPINQTLKYFISEQSLQRLITELQQMNVLQKEQTEKEPENKPLLMSNHEQSQEASPPNEEPLVTEKEGSETTALAPSENVEVAEERGSLKTENNQLKEELAKAREEKARVEGELAAYRMTGERLPQILEQVSKLSAENGKLIGDARVQAEAIKRLQSDNTNLNEKISRLEAPKKKSLFKFLK